VTPRRGRGIEGGSPWLARPTLDFLVLGSAALLLVTLLAAPWRWVLGWPAVSFLLLARACHSGRPETLGKRADGTRTRSAALLHLPYLLYSAAIRRFKRGLAIDPVPWHEVAPGIFLGRSPFADETTPDVAVAVDLAAEVATPVQRLAAGSHLSLPTLNKLAPASEAFARTVQQLMHQDRGIFVFCGAGKGRSATVVAALLIGRGFCTSPQDAESYLARIRPGVRLHDPQRRLLDSFSGVPSSLPATLPPGCPPADAESS